MESPEFHRYVDMINSETVKFVNQLYDSDDVSI